MTYAATGFPASAELAWAATAVLDLPGRRRLPRPRDGQRGPAGRRLAHPPARGGGRAEVVGTAGRSAFYLGDFGAALVELGNGYFTRGDLARSQAEWVTPLRTRAWGHDIWAPPPPSQGYLTLAGSWVADHLDVPTPRRPGRRSRLGAPAQRGRPPGGQRPPGRPLRRRRRRGAAGGRPAGGAAGRRRPRAPRPGRPAGRRRRHHRPVRGRQRAHRRRAHPVQRRRGGAAASPSASGIFLHNRGIGFSLAAGAPGRVGPGARPPHTLAPALVTTPDGRLRLCWARWGRRPAAVPAAAAGPGAGRRRGPRAGARRRALAAGVGQLRHLGRGPGTIRIESHASDEWDEGLQARGHDVMRSSQPVDLAFGQAHMIGVGDDGVLDGASDPRAVGGGAAGY